MRVSTLAFSALIGAAAAAPYYPFPLADGFPKPNPTQLKTIETLAGGSLPGGPLPSKLTAAATVTLQLIVLNELFEVAYFNQLLSNITNNVAGYTTFPSTTSRDFVVKTITAIKNQEELHALGANAALAAAGQTTIAPCSYNIPVNSFASAIALANTFTDVVLGVLPQAQVQFATDGDGEIPVVNLIGSIIAQEAEQNGWYRSVQTKIPSAAPFLTTEGPSFAFTFLSSVIAPGCPGVDLVAKSVPRYKPLTVLYGPAESDVGVRYSVEGPISETANSIVYLTGQNLPVTSKIYDVICTGNTYTFKAKFPFASDGFAKGLTVAAVVNTPAQAYANASMVAAHTIYGPGIIEVS